MTPFFSLILPCYQVAQYLERCVRSILTQDFDDHEIILVDDGSTDETPALCDRLAAEYACIRVIHKENGGLASARNAGLDAAQGRYVWFVDADDWIEPGALTLLHQACCADEPDVVKFDHYRVEDGVTVTAPFEVDPGLYQGEDVEMLRRKAFCAAGKYGLSACMHVYRRELLEAQGLRFVSERQVGSEDYLFNLQVMLHVRKLHMLRAPLYSYERRAGSLTQTYKPDLLQRYIRLKELTEAYYAEQQALARYERLIDRFFIWHLVIGTCLMHEYETAAVRTMQEARRCVGQLLRRKEVQRAAKRSDRTGLPWKKKVQLLAVRLRLEPLFYQLFAVRPLKKKG